MLHVLSDDTHGIQFVLTNEYYSYCFFVFDSRILSHLFWGSPIEGAVDPVSLIHPRQLTYMPDIHAGPQGKVLLRELENDRQNKLRGNSQPQNYSTCVQNRYNLGTVPQEYPTWGTGDLREGVFNIRFADGSEVSRLEYLEHELYEQAVQPYRMFLLSRTIDNYTTLRVRLKDPRGDFAVDLFYIFSEHSPVLLRWARFINIGSGKIRLENPASCSLDLPFEHNELIRLGGSWGRERHVQRIPLCSGRFFTGSNKGASGHQSNPFIALCEQGCSETHGQVWALALAYSGNFTADCLVDEHDLCRISIGINKLYTELPSGDCFDTPIALLVHSQKGFSSMSHRFHHFIRHDVLPHRDKPQKIIINSWESMYFDIDSTRIITLAKEGKTIGAEMLVLDDGWFSNRRDDTSSLGDWWYNPDRFPEGLGALGDTLREEGIEFGLWIEPEMVSRASTLYDAHPDWVLQSPGREGTEGRNQLILDLANPKVVEHLYNNISEILSEARPSYIKWDMNRNMTEPSSTTYPPEKQGEVMHLYILGLYSLFERIQKRFPDIVIEGCAGGGGRFDLGLARFCPRFWTSDQTDAVERLPIQYGTSLIFPPEMMGSHVSAVPNHIIGRTTPAWTRCLTAMPFSFGFELSPEQVSELDRKLFKMASQWYIQHRDIIKQGDFIRLMGPLSDLSRLSDYAWMIQSLDKKDLLIFYFRTLYSGRAPWYLQLNFPADTGYSRYQDVETGRTYQRVILEQRGLHIPEIEGDYQGVHWHLRGCEN